MSRCGHGEVCGEGKGTPMTLHVGTTWIPEVREITDQREHPQIFSESSSQPLLHGFSFAKPGRKVRVRKGYLEDE